MTQRDPNTPVSIPSEDSGSSGDSGGLGGNSRLSHDFASSLSDYGRPWEREQFPHLKLHIFNNDLAQELDLTESDILKATTGTAMAYSGHQFGHFNPTMGDVRALLLGEVTPASDGGLLDVHLKGSGTICFSRRGDGQATLGPMLREYLMSEALHALGVPNTRSLGIWTTGKKVLRTKVEQGALLERTARSHIRVGAFQYGATKDQGTPQDLLNYTIRRHYPGENLSAQGCFTRTVTAQAQLIATWMRLGFIHGVMNTDNTTISGETIDYGPCVFMDYFDTRTVFSTIDTQGRYSYTDQPIIIGWNLARPAETLIDAIGIDHAQETMNRFPATYHRAWLEEMARAWGMPQHSTNPTFAALADEFIDILTEEKLDLTTTMRWLSEDPTSHTNPYSVTPTSSLHSWVRSWRKLKPNHEAMQRINPICIPRNHLVDHAIKHAEEGHMASYMSFLARVTNPFTPTTDHVDEYSYRWPAPPEFTESFITYCGT